MKKIDLKKRTLQAFHQLKPELQKKAIFLAISGGRDSVALAHILISLKEKLPQVYWLHVNYGMRQPQCDYEETYLRQWAKQLEVPLFVKKISKKNSKENFQNWARTQRYLFFSEQIEKKTEALLWTAHHQDDQVETLLQKLISVGEFQGMQTVQVLKKMHGVNFKNPLTIFRPWLEIPRVNISDHIQRKRLQFFEDHSNQKLDYQRNRIRHKILPLLKEENPNFNLSLCDSLKKIQQQKENISERAGKWLKRNLKKDDNLLTAELKKTDIAIQRQIFHQWINSKLSGYRNQGKVVEKILNTLNKKNIIEQGFKLKAGWGLFLNNEKCVLKYLPNETRCEFLFYIKQK